MNTEKILTHGQQIKTASWTCEPKVTVWTLEGNARKYAKIDGISEEAAIQEAYVIELKRCVRQGCKPLVCGALSVGAMITDNYKGKAEAMQKESEAYQNAVELKNGDIVRIEGIRYFVRRCDKGAYVRYSNPLDFEVIPEYPDYN